ncbi:DUF3793 family protein [Clostridium cylindrosporum]|uniref:DUF3793 family protein n=1 Tax=Clostridium cylindrosporum DSM 605 TaxID=1121307 RepID=A0A0J8DCV7_CLOCY|nr:DUF3793 family protein [Clostridium cylindrosporum]KMT22083.1 hypothetical protein CLCY_4c00560 [Clostridium cylindrosporum DSM 605]
MNTFKNFEKILALHCSPTLVGIKPSNLISCYKKHYSNIPYLIKTYNTVLNKKNIFLEILCEYKSYYLILVYNKNLLNSILMNPSCQGFLKLNGYPDINILDAINTLKHKVLNINNFPHEIGLFLGYPLDDIIGFIENKGQSYKFYGYWKVYSNEEYAKSLFNQYDKCRESFVSKLLLGNSIMDIINVI